MSATGSTRICTGFSAWEYEKKLGVSRQFVIDMIFDLFRDRCLEGTSSVMPPGHYQHKDSTDSAYWGRGQREQNMEKLLKYDAFAAYINHRGRLRLWRLRDEVQKARTKEKFGILWDRRHWDADVAIQLAMRPKNGLSAVLFMDLDNFKPVNDRLGHDVGDDVLKTFFQSVAKLASVDGGEGYGWGGDEVVVLLPDTNQDRAAAIENAIRTVVAEECSAHPTLAAAKLPISVSIGTYVFAEHKSPSEIVKAADDLMYADKAKGKQERAKEGATP